MTRTELNTNDVINQFPLSDAKQTLEVDAGTTQEFTANFTKDIRQSIFSISGKRKNWEKECERLALLESYGYNEDDWNRIVFQYESNT